MTKETALCDGSTDGLFVFREDNSVNHDCSYSRRMIELGECASFIYLAMLTVRT